MIKNKTLLFIHQNFPAQFLHVCRQLAPDNRIFFITKKNANRIPGVRLIEYELKANPDHKPHAYLNSLQNAVYHAQGATRAMIALKRQGIRPDLIVGHCGWGETIFVKDIFPNVPLLSYFEFFYAASGADANFDKEFPVEPDLPLRTRMRNMTFLSCLESTDVGLSPTKWQHSRLPEIFQSKVEIIHEGVDTTALVPSANPSVRINDRLSFDGSVPLVTYVARNLEPHRGFHVFMRAVKPILDQNPQAHIVIVGGEDVSYSRRLPNGESYKQRALKENPVDLSRVHFVGKIPYDTFKQLLQVSDAHVYLTYPFVLSWSFLEAMSTECLVIGSKTPPVEEVVRHGENGLLVDFFDPTGIAAAVTEALRNKERFREMRRAARQTVVENYDLTTVTLPKHLALLERMINRQ
jgi:glycosyltransferase involved in cell wall biosynthesis